MSVTVQPESHPADLLGWGVECGCGSTATGALAHTADRASGWLRTYGWCGADVCAHEYAVVVPVTIPFPWVNMANGNACRVLGELGYPDEAVAFGDDTAQGFLGRVLLALAVVPADEGVPAVADGNMVDCGRRPGYLQDRLGDLHRVALWCRDHERRVVWS